MKAIKTYNKVINSSIGLLQIQVSEEAVLSLSCLTQDENSSPCVSTDDAFISEKAAQLFSSCEKQLAEYFSGKRKFFELPFSAKGTEFQKKVWQQLNAIPFGHTTSYLKLAQNLNSPKSVRAVGRAIGQNPLLIFVPCHRVIGSNGSLTGFAGGIDKKKMLLQNEGINF